MLKKSVLLIVQEAYRYGDRHVGLLVRLKDAGFEMHANAELGKAGVLVGSAPNDFQFLNQIEGVEFVEENYEISIGLPDAEVR